MTCKASGNGANENKYYYTSQYIVKEFSSVIVQLPSRPYGFFYLTLIKYPQTSFLLTLVGEGV